MYGYDAYVDSVAQESIIDGAKNLIDFILTKIRGFRDNIKEAISNLKLKRIIKHVANVAANDEMSKNKGNLENVANNSIVSMIAETSANIKDVMSTAMEALQDLLNAAKDGEGRTSDDFDENDMIKPDAKASAGRERIPVAALNANPKYVVDMKKAADGLVNDKEKIIYVQRVLRSPEITINTAKSVENLLRDAFRESSSFGNLVQRIKQYNFSNDANGKSFYNSVEKIYKFYTIGMNAVDAIAKSISAREKKENEKNGNKNAMVEVNGKVKEGTESAIDEKMLKKIYQKAYEAALDDIKQEAAAMEFFDSIPTEFIY